MSEQEQSPQPVRHGRLPQPRRRKRIALLTALVLVLLLGVAAAWIGMRGMQAKNALTTAESLVAQVRATAVSDPKGALGRVDQIEAQTARARELTSDWVWSTAELLPVVGKNLTAARQLTAAVDEISTTAIAPLAAVAATLDISSLKPVDGRINLTPIIAATSSIATADDAIGVAKRTVASIDTAGTLDFVVSSRTRLATVLTEAGDITASLRKVTQLLPPMLGATEPRNYLLMFQNNAEARSLGGNPAALVLVTVDKGKIAIIQQASSRDFANGTDPPLTLDPNILKVYYAAFPRYVMDITTRPDFPTAATLAQAYWKRQFGLTVDGVVSFDPVALSYLLRATGPMTLPAGEKVTADNAVSLLLSEVYSRYPKPADQDIFFAAAAKAVFGSLTGGGAQPKAMLAALSQATDEGRLMVWSNRPAEQAVVATTPLSGILPTDNVKSTTLGVYFMDQSSSKIDYHVGSAVSVAVNACTSAAPSFTAKVTLRSLITQAQADALPAYVQSTWWKGRKFRTDIYVLGPVGASYQDTVVDTPGLLNQVLSTGTDLGRPIVRLAVELQPAQSSTVTVRFTGTPQAYGPLALRTTPMVNPTVVDVQPCK